MLQINYPELFSDLLDHLDRIQEILVSVATGTGRIQDLSSEYANLINMIEVKSELLQDEGRLESSPALFENLWDWYHYYRDNEQYRSSAQKGNFVYDYYAQFSHVLEAESLKLIGEELSFAESYKYSEADNLQLFRESFQSISKLLLEFSRSQNFPESIQERECDYKRIRKEILMCLSVYDPELSEAAILELPKSLWQIYGLFQGELTTYKERERYVNDLFRSEKRAIDKRLLRASIASSSERSNASSTDEYREILSRAMSSSQDSSKIEVLFDREKDSVTPDFSILTAIEDERIALCKVFNINDNNRIRRDARTYWQTTLHLPNDQHYNIILAQAPDMANVDAALLAADTLNHWQPSTILMVGIAAAASREQYLGDIILGKDIYYYNRGKVTDSGIFPDLVMYRPDATLWDRVITTPKTGFDIQSARPDGTDNFPNIYPGVIASGEQVIAHAAARDDIAKGHRKIKAIEMEGYGVSAAAHQRFEQTRCLVIRALCDYADGEKNDTWHEYAAAAAAGFTKHFPLDMPLEPRNSKQS